ncbi:Breast carcinoma-amplified protein 3 [Danaus plexippus plexippus]|uniref:Breast carcinoma-amplified protein 3 n=1 Tax=Danaus plexippus plexippus TaxID=278856 RepID=A0A212ES97_DANPL|nr:Breast carcinoma-amplified protein 3 [Danaus plexippus plexippus]
MSAESPRHARSGGPLTVPSQPPSDRSIIDAVSGFINDVTLSSSSTVDPKDVIQWARFETADINEPTQEGDGDNDVPPLLLILGYGSGVQVWLIPSNGEAQEVLSWRQGTVRVLRILPTPQHGDCFASKRPLIALCDSASPGPAFCSLIFLSIRGGEQVKSIKFKNPILDVLANKRSVVVSFSERFAVFDAATLEDRLAVTTCYPCPCPLGGSAPINPLTLGDRWLAYAEKKLNPSKRSSGGCETEGVTSYTATVLHAAKSLSKGLRGLGETVAHSLAGGRSTSQSPSPPHADIQQPGVVTILDIEGNEDEDSQDCEEPCDPIVAHFIAHSEAIIALKFDPSGMLLVTADRRGHDFHVFRINPHPCGPSLASVHHLYILHRGDTTSKVQDICISGDSRWAAISTLRGTTHVFAISPYGGAIGVRTHTQPRLVNRLSRFHRSAGLPIHHTSHVPPAAHSPVLESGAWFPNPRLPPYPQPATCSPLAQLRPTHLPTTTITRNSSGRQRLSSLSEEGGAAPLLARACFGVSGSTGRAASVPLYLAAANGALLHLALHPKPARSVPKEKICDESPIELEVEAVSQWPLQRPAAASDLLAPLPPSNPLLQPMSCRRCADICMSEEERWLSQVEIVTHAGPHRRLWMGPQFVFKTYNCTGSTSSLSEAEAVEVDASAAPARSNPVNMPGARPAVPVLIDSGSASSLEHSPSDSFRRKSLLEPGRVCDVQLREDLAEAMKEDHGLPRVERACSVERGGAVVARDVGPTGAVAAHREEPHAPALDADAHTTCNTDEAAFRPVVRAPATLSPLTPALSARELPCCTTIPAQPAPPRRASPDDNPLPLTTDVVIPAELTDGRLEFTHLPAAEPITDTIGGFDSFADLDVKNTFVHRDLDYSERMESERMNDRAPAPDKSDEVPSSLPKPKRPSDDIQPSARPRVKKSPTTKTHSDRAASDIDKLCVNDKDFMNIHNDDMSSKLRAAEKEIKPQKGMKVSKGIEKQNQQGISKNDKDITQSPEPNVRETTTKYEKHSETIRTEDQAWDMLLNDTQQTSKKDVNLVTANKVEIKDDVKAKTKKSRKSKKSIEDQQAKDDEDSFIEIHNIEEKQTTSGDLVSISMPFEDIESSYLPKSKRRSKSRTPERKDVAENKQENINEQDFDIPNISKKNNKMNEILTTESKTQPISLSTTKDIDSKQKELLNVDAKTGNEPKAGKSLSTKESPKLTKRKSPSPKVDRKEENKADDKEVYVIETTDDDFPEIQITKGNKSNKRSFQLYEKKKEEAAKPAKSWSSVAASKNKKVDEVKVVTENIEEQETEDEEMKSPVSLQEKLFELCKRRDIMVAECDAPSELNFVEEHHAVVDLPPLEQLDFGLDNFSLEVMRDSLLEVNEPKVSSPICKINIDEILSSIKETTSKAIETSTFNLIDVEKVPARKERGFNIVESDKITSQEVKLEDEVKFEKDELEKSSDEEMASPVLSTDSDKEEKKSSENSNATPTAKQSKSKKSRRKKKL